MINPAIETVLQNTILPELEKGRKDFDRPHTVAVVYWMKKLLEQLKNPALDSQVLITAAYAHDWGYIGLFEGVDAHDPRVIKERKPLHMEKGAQYISQLIDDKLSSFFTPEQKAATAHLVFMHDKVEELQTEEEILIMEADTMGLLDASRVSPSFSKADNDVFMQQQFYGRRLLRFMHPYAKEKAQELAALRIAFYA